MHLSTADLSRPQANAEWAASFFQSIPVGEQKLTISDWATKNGGQLPPKVAAVRLWPGTQTAGQWLASQNGRLRT